ncbi:MAG: ribonuclease III [Pseudomonadota bacterium]
MSAQAKRHPKPESQLGLLEDGIGYTFSDHANLKRALTHSSAVAKGGEHYERLEFLGDRILGLCVAEMLYEAFPDASEGELSVRLNAMVSGNTCAEIADVLELHRFIHAGTDVSSLTGKRMRSVRADVVESIIAALYLDGGIEAARTFVERMWNTRLHEVGAGTQDSKTALQEWAHQATGATPRYRLVSRTGPDHAPTFVVAVDLEGKPGEQGAGKSKREAEQVAAQAVLLREGAWQKTPDGSVREKRK